MKEDAGGGSPAARSRETSLERKKKNYPPNLSNDNSSGQVDSVTRGRQRYEHERNRYDNGHSGYDTSGSREY
ncbi:hypothetical protein CVS40_3356 [Lucilia cuprina]|nr:hypothetical protein CVS40_3356 [Lucilia cuprina]